MNWHKRRRDKSILAVPKYIGILFFRQLLIQLYYLSLLKRDTSTLWVDATAYHQHVAHHHFLRCWRSPCRSMHDFATHVWLVVVCCLSSAHSSPQPTLTILYHLLYHFPLSLSHRPDDGCCLSYVFIVHSFVVHSHPLVLCCRLPFHHTLFWTSLVRWCSKYDNWNYCF